MAHKQHSNPVSIAVGAALIATLASAPLIAQADTNPFTMTALERGYMVAEKSAEGKCGEAKCGGDKAAKKVAKEGQCGGNKTAKEGNCGANKDAAMAKPIVEAKCGEAKCGGNK